MRIAHLSDLHIIDGPRLDDHAETLANVVTEVLTLRPDLVLLTGDLTGRTVPHRTTPRERGVLYPQLVRLAEAAPVLVLAGNHDHDIDIDALEYLDGAWPIRVLKAAGLETITTAAGPVDVCWLAYPTKRWLLAGEPATGLREAQTLVQDKLGVLTSLWAARIKRARASRPRTPQLFLGHVQIGGSRTSGGEVLAGNEIELQRQHLDALGVDYGALGHIHQAQEIADRCWYVGSLWRNDYAETEAFKGWNLIDIDPAELWPAEPTVGEDPGAFGAAYYAAEPGGRQEARVLAMPSHCRRFVTLDYRWGLLDDDQDPEWSTAPSWTTRPDSIDHVAGAEVRMRLEVPQHLAAGCPWDAEIERVRAAGAHRIQPERRIDPTHRVRSPEVARAQSIADKARAYWRSLATAPSDEEQRQALAQLDELLTLDDEAIAARGTP